MRTAPPRRCQDNEDLTSEHLEIGLRPIDPARRAAAAATRPDANSPGGDVELDTLYASDNVKVKGTDSAVAADDLKVERVNGFSRVTLHGKPAVVTNKDSTISGPAILLSSENQTSSVEGPGTLIAAQSGRRLPLENRGRSASTGKPARPGFQGQQSRGVRRRQSGIQNARRRR